MAFRFTLNHEDESSLFFSLLSALRPPLLPNLPSFFSSFFMWDRENETRSNREGRGKRDEGVFGVREQMEAVFSTKVENHATSHTDTSGYFLYLQ